MNRGLVAGIFFFGAAAATAGCVDDATNNLEVRTSALGGFNGTTVASAVRAFRRSDNVYEGVFRSRVGGAVQVTGNPFNASRVMASNVVATSTPWVFQRSLDKATVAYVSADQHVHVVAEERRRWHFRNGDDGLPGRRLRSRTAQRTAGGGARRDAGARRPSVTRAPMEKLASSMARRTTTSRRYCSMRSGSTSLPI